MAKISAHGEYAMLTVKIERPVPPDPMDEDVAEFGMRTTSFVITRTRVLRKTSVKYTTVMGDTRRYDGTYKVIARHADPSARMAEFREVAAERGYTVKEA